MRFAIVLAVLLDGCGTVPLVGELGPPAGQVLPSDSTPTFRDVCLDADGIPFADDIIGGFLIAWEAAYDEGVSKLEALSVAGRSGDEIFDNFLEDRGLSQYVDEPFFHADCSVVSASDLNLNELLVRQLRDSGVPESDSVFAAIAGCDSFSMVETFVKCRSCVGTPAESLYNLDPEIAELKSEFGFEWTICNANIIDHVYSNVGP